MGRRLAVLIVGMIVGLAALACGQTATPMMGAAIVAQETEVARATRDAMNDQARATADALAVEAQATRQAADAIATQAAGNALATAQVMDALATVQAMDALATRTAQDTQATATALAATATAAACEAQATQAAAQATATRQAALVQAESVELTATAQAIARQTKREESTQFLTTFAGWLMLALLVAVALAALWLFLPIMARRAAVIRRRHDEGEPVILERERIVLPMRTFGPWVEAAPDPALQDRATARQQAANLLLAKHAHQSGGPVIVAGRRGGACATSQGPDSDWQDVTPTVYWPSRVPLRGLLPGGEPSYRDLALGVTVHEDGGTEVIRADMTRLVHIAVGGSSGWGKSVFLQSLAWQLAQSRDPVDLVLIDLEAVTFAQFAQCKRLLWQIADTERDTLSILSGLTDEMNRRRDLYGSHPGATDLDGYNARAGDPLRPIVVIFDEATALLADKRIEGAIKTLALRARKFGVWLVLGGQDWKASSLDTAIRNQLSTRVQFKTMGAAQSRVLLQRGGAETLDVPGRALAILPGRDVVKMQAPWVGQDMLATIPNGGPRCELPAAAQTDSNADQTDTIRRMHANGASLNEIQQNLFGYTGGAAYSTVKAALT